MGFMDNLRLNNIYPLQGTMPDVSVKSFTPGQAALDFSAHVQPFLDNQAYLERAHKLQDQNAAIGLQRIMDLNKGMTGTQGMNTVFTGITPYQQAGLDLRRQELEDKRQTGDEQAEINRAKLQATQENNQGNLGIRQQRADTYDFSKRNPEQKFLPVKGGDYMAGNPLTGELSDTGVNTGMMTDEDKQIAAYKQALDLLRGRNQNSLDLQKMRNQGALDQINQRAATRPAPINREMLPTQSRVDIANRGKQLFNQHPELTQYLQFDESGYPMIKSGTSPDIAHQINNYLYSTPTQSSGGNDNDPLGLNLGGGGDE